MLIGRTRGGFRPLGRGANLQGALDFFLNYVDSDLAGALAIAFTSSYSLST